jgi:hypothetical protein
VSTHAAPHCVSPTAHADWHAPFEQASPVAHACPHEPQLFASLDSSTHVPLHDTSDPLHDIDGGKPHSPLMHW